MATDIGVDEVTPEMIQLWQRLNEILDEDAHRSWEEDKPPGRRREFSDTCVALHRRLGLKPWEM